MESSTSKITDDVRSNTQFTDTQDSSVNITNDNLTPFQ